MRHLYDNIRLGRTAEHRHALLHNMSTSLFLHRRVITTLTKAKYVRRFAERMITFARKGDFSARRHVSRFILDRDVLKKLFNELGPHFQHRNGGYTRIIHLGNRQGDNAPMAILELVGFDDLLIAPVEAPKTTETKSRLKKSQKAASTPNVKGEAKKTKKKASDTASSAKAG